MSHGIQRPRIVLASKSPRRREILSNMGFDFSVRTKEVDESYPNYLKPIQAALFISKSKAQAFLSESMDEVLITADTIVCIEHEIIGKPRDEADAFRILETLSDRMHTVITAVTFLQDQRMDSFYDITEVYFNKLNPKEIDYYIHTFNPYDKAGAYGIQDWIGYVGVKKIIGSYTNVIGLPSELVYHQLKHRGLTSF